MVAALALAGCRSDLDPKRVADAVRAETERHWNDAFAAGARARYSMPLCSQTPSPEGTLRRVSGTLAWRSRGFMMTDNLCPVQNPCCQLVTPLMEFYPDKGRPEPAESLLSKLMKYHGNVCDYSAWLKGFGAPRVALIEVQKPGSKFPSRHFCRLEE